MICQLPMHRPVLVALALAVVALGTAPAALNGRPVSSSGSVTRVAGADRYATAAAVSRSSQPVGVPVAYIATGTGFPDALGAGPAAARQGGPLLLTAPGSLPKATTDELRRLKPGRMARHRARFTDAVANDLGTPRAVAIAHDVASAADLTDAQRRTLLLDFDRVLGLSLDAPAEAEPPMPDGAAELLELRAAARAAKDWATSDALRNELAALGVEVRDTGSGQETAVRR